MTADLLLRPLHKDDLRSQSYSPDLQLLLCCARTSITPEIEEQIKGLLSLDLDWSMILGTAGQHGVLPLLYQSLKTVAPQSVPAPILAQLQQYAQHMALANTVFAKELLSVLKLLEQHGIRAIPFKGPVLAVAAYGNLGLRHFCDLDIWVDPQRSLDAIALLTAEAGYQSGRQWHFLNATLESSYMQSWREYTLSKGNIAIDLHQNLTVERFLSSAFTFEQLWEHHTSLTLAGQQIPSFSGGEQLIYLCLHGTKECWRSLKWICDVAQWVQMHPNIDWQATVKLSQDLHCGRRLLIGLNLAHQTLGTPLPNLIEKQQLQDKTSQQLVQQFTKRLFEPNNPLGRNFTFKKLWFHVQSVENTRDQWACIEELQRLLDAQTAKIWPNNLDHDFLPLPRPLYFLYFLLRPIRLIRAKSMTRSTNDNHS